MELYTPELYKVMEFMNWQPKIYNNIFFIEDTVNDAALPIVSHLDLKNINLMPHRSPILLNNEIKNGNKKMFESFSISFKETYGVIFDRQKIVSIKFLHFQYLNLLSLYDLPFFAEKIKELLVSSTE